MTAPAATRPPDTVRRRWVGPLVVAVAALVALGADLALDPFHRDVPLCPFHAATGWDCPLCGGLRAADALARLRLGPALRANLLFVLAAPLLVLWWADWAAARRRGRAARSPSRTVVLAIIVLALVFTVVRNLSFGSALRPS